MLSAFYSSNPLEPPYDSIRDATCRLTSFEFESQLSVLPINQQFHFLLFPYILSPILFLLYYVFSVVPQINFVLILKIQVPVVQLDYPI